MLKRILALADYIHIPPGIAKTPQDVFIPEVEDELRELIRSKVMLSPGGIVVRFPSSLDIP